MAKKKPVEEWVVRLHEEREQLANRYNRLAGFLDIVTSDSADKPKGISKKELAWMDTQRRLMKCYLDVLDYRCELHPLNEEEGNV